MSYSIVLIFQIAMSYLKYQYSRTYHSSHSVSVGFRFSTHTDNNCLLLDRAIMVCSFPRSDLRSISKSLWQASSIWGNRAFQPIMLGSVSVILVNTFTAITNKLLKVYVKISNQCCVVWPL